MAIEMPQGELHVSYCSYDGEYFSARFVVADHPESIGPESVLCIEAKGILDATAVTNFLQAQRDSGETVYLGSTDAGISLESEFGEAICIQGANITLSFDTLNADELREALAQVYSWYQSTDTALANALDRIRDARGLVEEQTLRVQIKAANKAEGTTAATLYSQHLQLLQRVLNTLEPGK